MVPCTSLQMFSEVGPLSCPEALSLTDDGKVAGLVVNQL